MVLSWSEVLVSLAKLTARHPIRIVVVTLIANVLMSICLFVNLHVFSFDEPLRGFESRGSDIANRINTWKLISGKTGGADDITLYPAKRSLDGKIIFSNDSSWRTYSSESNDKAPEEDNVFRILDEEEEEEKKRIAQDVERKQEEMRNKLTSNNHLLGSGFCGELSDAYVQFVIEPLNPTSDLLTHEYLLSICKVDSELRGLTEFSQKCITPGGDSSSSTHSCCKSWSLPNLIARGVNKTDCNSITPADVVFIRELLDSCVEDFHRRTLHRNCFQDPRSCPEIPSKCYAKENLVFNIFNYIVDIEFVDTQERTGLLNAKVKKSNIFLPIAKSSDLLTFFQETQENVLFGSNTDKEQKLVKISSLDVGLKDTLFEQLLVQDTKLLAFAFISIIILLWIYSRSFLIVLMTAMNLMASLGGSLLIYRFILGISFFPFMNLLTVIILIAVGTDSTFIMCKAWSHGLEEKNRRPIQDHLMLFYSRTFTSTFLTNSTTALALLASLSSEITSLQCFSVYSALAVFFLYILTIISIPAVLVVTTENDIFASSTRRDVTGSDNSSLGHKNKFFSRIQGHSKFSSLKYIVMIIMLIVSATSIYLLIQSFQVPNTEHFSTFYPDHPFETFDIKYRDVFKFSQRTSGNEDPILSGLPIIVVFGVRARDNGFSMDPFSRGTLDVDEDFDVSSTESQRWLLSFCPKLRNVSFYRPVHGPLLSNCFIETFKTFIEERKCFDPITQVSHYPCCQDSPFPYSSSVIKSCLGPALEMFYRTPTYVVSREAPGVRFSRTTNKIVSIIVQYYSNISYTNSYALMRDSLNEIDEWFKTVLQDAPKGLKSSWFISDHLELFALQESLIKGTYVSVFIALLCSFLFIVLTTRDIILTFFAFLTIGSIITTTLGTLFYFFSWQVNVIESIVISIAVGISVDLPLHFVISFKQHDVDNLSNKTSRTLSDVGLPLFAAASTTSIGGLWMLQSQILAYLRIGMFLCMVSLFNILFTFLLLSSLLLILESFRNKSSSRQSQTEFLRNDLVLNDFD
jgi:hypothetical protein